MGELKMIEIKIEGWNSSNDRKISIFDNGVLIAEFTVLTGAGIQEVWHNTAKVKIDDTW